MEFAVAYQTIDQLEGFDKNLQNLRVKLKPTPIYEFQEKVYKNILSKLKEYYKEIQCDVIYFGSEFCENLIPDVDTIEKVINFCDKNHLRLALVTPLVSNKGISSLIEIFEYLKKNSKSIEVIANDYGVMNLVSKNYPNLRLISGRLMHKMTSDPRIKNYIDNLKKLPIEVGMLRYMRSSAYSMSDFLNFMNRLGISHGELDAVYQGIDFDIPGEYTFSLNLPYTYISSGRYCIAGSIHNSFENKFSIDLKCKKECENYIVRLNKDDIGEKIFRRGKGVVNTFYENIDMTQFINENKLTRIVLTPYITF